LSEVLKRQIYQLAGIRAATVGVAPMAAISVIVFHADDWLSLWLR
jgi:hypothetical protein